MDSAQLNRLSDEDLVASLKALVERCNQTEADVIEHIQEVDARRLYLGRAHGSLFAFCMAELGFSESATYNRIEVARAAVRFPAMLEHLRRGDAHVSGLRLLAPHLTPENQDDLLTRATRKSKRQIDEIVASLAPKPAVPDSIRKLPERPSLETIPAAPALVPLLALTPPAPALPPSPPLVAAELPPQRRPVVEPLAEDAFRVQFTASRALEDKLREAQDLLRHQIPNGDLAQIVEKALDQLIAATKKKRFGVGAKPRLTSRPAVAGPATSRHVPNDFSRAVYERDGGRCTFVDERGHRCEETGGLELDHVDGFARVRAHDPARLRLRCKAHNQYGADLMYGRDFMERARARRQLVPGQVPPEKVLNGDRLEPNEPPTMEA